MAAKNADESLDIVRAYFAGQDAFRLVLVYGSAAAGRLNPSSDVDIAVAGERPFDKMTLLAVEGELSALLERPVDLIDLNRVEGLILREAIVHGLRIKLDRELFVKFHCKVMTYREDFLPLRRFMQDKRIERFIHGQGRRQDKA